MSDLFVWLDGDGRACEAEAVLAADYRKLEAERNEVTRQLSRLQAACRVGTATELQILTNSLDQLHAELKECRQSLIREGMERDAFKSELELARKCVEALRAGTYPASGSKGSAALAAYDQFKEKG